MMELKDILEEALRGHRVGVEGAELILRLEGCPGELLEAAWEVRRRNLGGEMRFYYPLPRFPSISVTGYRCSLNCQHCRGRYLRQMEAVESPEELIELCKRLERMGATGCLVSGGSDPYGSVPLRGFYGALRRVKEETGLIVNVHTGLVDGEQAEEIAGTGIDVASLDVVGDRETIKRVIGLDKGPEDYLESIRLLKEAGVPSVVPHICTGLDWGRIRGEARALWGLSDLDPEVIVILGLRPTKGTPMESAPPPSPETLARMVAAARLMFPRASIALGCMRPHQGRGEAEKLALKAGADRLVLPRPRTIRVAEEMGLHPIHLDACCAVPTTLEERLLRESHR